MNDTQKTASNPLPRQWSLLAVTLMIPAVAVGFVLPHAPKFGLGMAFIGGLICLLGWWRHGLLRWGAGMIFMAMMIILTGSQVQERNSSIPSIRHHQELEAVGTVVMTEAMTKSRQRVIFSLDRRTAETAGGSGHWRLLLPSRMAPVTPGDHIRITARISPPLPQLLPDGFDFTAHAHRKGISATGFIAELEVIGHGQASVISRFRAAVQSRLHRHLDAEDAAVASALLVGLRAAIPRDLREQFRAAGLAHLLAISGLHMALFCGGVVYIIRAGLGLLPHFSSRHSALKIAATVALPTGLGYLLLAGMPISAIRAYGMMVLLITAILIDRRGLTLHHVALMALLLVIFDPSALTHPAFQMSFAAVFALVAGWMFLQKARLKWGIFHDLRPVSRLGQYIGGIMMASVLASTASMPFVLHHFGVTTAWSILANVIGMPLMAFIIMPAGALALLLMPIGLEFLALLPMELGLGMLINLAGLIEGLPLSSWRLPPPSGGVLLLLTLAVLIPFSVPYRVMLISPVLLLSAVAVWVMTPVPVAAVIHLHGRMHAVVIDDKNRAVASSTGNSFAASILRRPFGVSQTVLVDESDHHCQSGFCLITMAEGRTAAFVFARHGLTKACREADLVLALVRADYPCRSGAVLIDRNVLEVKGGALVYESQNQLVPRHVSMNE